MKIKKIWMPSKWNALFTILTPNTIWINKDRADDFLMPAYIEHEKCHRRQFFRYWFIGYFLLKVFWRRKLEKEAYKVEDAKILELEHSINEE